MKKPQTDTFLSRPSKHNETGSCHEEKNNCPVQFQRFQHRSLFACGKDLEGWAGPPENLSPTFCPSSLGSEFRPDYSGHCLAGPQSRGSTRPLGRCSNNSHSDIPTSSQSLFSFSFLLVLGAPHWRAWFSFSAALPMATDWQLCGLPKPLCLQAEVALFPQPLLTGQVLQLSLLQPSSEFVLPCQHFSCVVGPKASVTQLVLDRI